MTMKDKQANASNASERTVSTRRSDMRAEANPQQLAMLTQVLNDFCHQHHIEAICERENAAALITCLYQRGYASASDLNAILEMAETVH